MRAILLVVLLAFTAVAGCLEDKIETDATDSQPALVPALLGDQGIITLDVPVDVYMVGFPNATAMMVQAELEPEPIAHQVYSFGRTVLGPDGTIAAKNNPVRPTAEYRVHAVPLGDLAKRLDDSATDGLYDANQAEDALVLLLEQSGYLLDPNRPALVLLHLGDRGHSYRIQYETGYVDQVRAFGERTPLLVLDVSAAVDPWVGNGFEYNSPLQFDEVGALADAARAATHFRLLQGPLYPPALAPCHAVTLLTAVRGTNLADILPGYASAQDLVQVENLTRSWEALLGEGRVHVDPVFLQLPTDDLVLEAVLRTGDLDLLRFWMDENWDDYWVPHDGCEAYVSIFLVGDMTDSGVSGIAMYDIRDDRRLSFSSFNDLSRMQEEGAGAGAPVFYIPDDSRYENDWLDFLYTHETGHLFGQRHPHDINLVGGGGFDPTFSSIWSAMSYQEDGKLPQFGVVDQANQARNRAGFLLQAVLELDPEHPAVDASLEHMGQYHWRAANQILEGALASAP